MKTYIISYKTETLIGSCTISVLLDNIKTNEDLAINIINKLEKIINTSYITIIGLWEITL